MSTEKQLILYEDRSSAEMDDACGMRFWFGRKEGGRGIVPVVPAEPLSVGAEIHSDLQTIAEMEDLRPEAIQEMIDDILNPLGEEEKSNQKRMELLYRRLGWFAAFALFIEPKVRERYRNIMIEDEIILDRGELWTAVTPDRVLESLRDTHLEYWEYKSTISAGPKWMSSWPKQIQPHIGIAAVEEELKREVKFCQIVGLLKGNYAAADRRLVHPYVWAWYSTEKECFEHDYDKTRGNQWISMPVWEFDPGIVRWVQRLGPEIARAQFPMSAPVFLNKRMLNKWVERRKSRQRQIKLVEDVSYYDEEVRAQFFEERTRNCQPPFGDPCPYLKCCWHADTNYSPLADPEFKPREPHHRIELIVEEMNYGKTS